jgi:hypothetical protein
MGVLLCLNGSIAVGVELDDERGGDVTTMVVVMWVRFFGWSWSIASAAKL